MKKLNSWLKLELNTVLSAEEMLSKCWRKRRKEGKDGGRDKGGEEKGNLITFPVSYPANTYEVFTVYHASIKCLLCTVHLLSVYYVPCTQAKHLV